MGVVCGMLAWALLGAAAPSASPAPGYASSPTGIIAEVHHRGAAPVAAELWGRKVLWEDVVGNVESADAGWLRAAAALRPGAPAGAVAELTDAVRLALMIDAKAVLANALPAFPIAEVCSGLRESSSSSIRPAEIVSRQIRAVKAVHGAQLAGVRKRCLARLEASRKALESTSP